MSSADRSRYRKRHLHEIRVAIRRPLHARILRLSKRSHTEFGVTLHALIIIGLRDAGELFDEADTSPEAIADALAYLTAPEPEPFEV